MKLVGRPQKRRRHGADILVIEKKGIEFGEGWLLLSASASKALRKAFKVCFSKFMCRTDYSGGEQTGA